MQDKICPLSFSFVMKIPSVSQATKPKVRIGFACMGERCMWWDNNAKQCRLVTIQMLLERIDTKK